MMNAHQENTVDKSENTEHDKEFKETYGSVAKRGEWSMARETIAEKKKRD